MTQRLADSVFQILNSAQEVVGAGFVLSDSLAVTCSHVVDNAESGPGQKLQVYFITAGIVQTINVLNEGWSPIDADDVAFLHLDDLPETIHPVTLGGADDCIGHNYTALGFPQFEPYAARWAQGRLSGVVPVMGGRQPLLQLQGDEIAKGISGAPVLDLQTDRVIGIITEYKNDENIRFGYATTTNTLQILNPLLKSWPNTFGPSEVSTYLNHLVEINKTIRLPNGYDVPLERLYVSLRADEMNAVERESEHEFYLKDVKALQELTKGSSKDQYSAYAAMCRVIVRRPKMQMLIARNWDTLFGERKLELLNLAEVLEQHPSVVLLGDPGSGKTTLGKWLTLQMARALKENEEHLIVQADLVQTSENADGLIDLGVPRLPLLIRVAEYARSRWDREGGDTAISLDEFIRRGKLDSRDLPHNLTFAIVGSIADDYLKKGLAFVVLDGLDEVSDPDRRREVMSAVDKFVTKHRSKGNHFLITSRIVGYQFHPLARLPHYTIEEMDEQSISAFCRAWMLHFHSEVESTVNAAKLRDAIVNHSHPGVRALAANPMLLTLLAQVYQDGDDGTLPARRVELFDEAFRAFYRQRELFWRQNNISSSQLARGLSAVAFHIQTNETTGFAERGAVVASLLEVFDENQVELALTGADEFSGFLVSRGEGIYGFIHRALQEYFVARYMTNRAEDVTKQLAEHALNPTWREPSILAIGIISESKYETRDNRLLEKVFSYLLEMEDRAGDYLPRRELLVATACRECQRIPNAAAERIFERLLLIYSNRETRSKNPILRQRIQRAIESLYRSPARESIESLLCAAIKDHNLERRFSGIDFVIEAKWDSPVIARTLVEAYRIYENPAGTLLASLYFLHARHPEYFDSEFVPFRNALEANPGLWEKITTNRRLSSLIKALYLAPGTDFSPKNIIRDSSLTPLLISSLNELTGNTLVSELKRRLKDLISNPDTRVSVDSAIALAALGDTTWLSRFTQTFQIDLKITTSILVKLIIGNCAFPAVRMIISDDNLISSIAEELGDTLDLDVVQGLARDRGGAAASGLSRSLVFTAIRSLEQTKDDIPLQSLFERIREAIAFASQTLISRSDMNDRLMSDKSGLNIDSAFALVRELDSDLVFVYIGELAQALREDLNLVNEYIGKLQKLETTMINVSESREADAEDLIEVNSALELLKDLEITISGLAPVMQSVIDSIPEKLTQIEDKNNPHVFEAPLERLENADIGQAILDLTSNDDSRRQRARSILVSDQNALMVGRSNIEQIATNLQQSNDPLLLTQLSWALFSILHNQGDWIREWARNVAALPPSIPESDQDRVPDELILNSIRKISLSAFEVLTELLPHPSARVNVALLESVSWLAREEGIEATSELMTSTLEKLKLWLLNEPNTKIQKYIIDVLGHWRHKPNAIQWLLDCRKQGVIIDEHRIYVALAQLAANSTYEDEVKTILIDKLAIREGASAFTRLIALSSASPIDLHKILEIQIIDPTHILDAILDAGIDDDVWKGGYHGLLVMTASYHIESNPTLLLPIFANRLRYAISQKEWPIRRMLLGTLAACLEIMPTAVQRAFDSTDELESLVVEGAVDPGSFNARRFAISSLSYLRTITPAVVPALLAGCQDAEIVQRDTIKAVERFQVLNGNPVPLLGPALVGESSSTAYAVARLLGSLGSSGSNNTATLRDQIITWLVEALKNPKSQREVLIPKDTLNKEPFSVDNVGVLDSKGKLEDTLYSVLLQIAGWID